MKFLGDNYIRLDKYCERCGSIVYMVIPNNLLFFIWGMYPKWDCLRCGHQQEAFTGDLSTLNEALATVYVSLPEDERPI